MIHAGSTTHLPLTEGETTLIYAVEGRVPENIQNSPNAQIRWVTPGFFDALQIPLARGRKFTSQDRTPSPPVIIINEALARRSFPGEEALGKRLFVGNPNNKPGEIVGIVRNTQEADLRETRRALIYIPYFQAPHANIRLAVKTQGDPAALGAVLGSVGAFAMTRWLRDLLFQVDPADPVTLAAVALFLVIVAIAASLVPARRATRIDPMTALRYE